MIPLSQDFGQTMLGNLVASLLGLVDVKKGTAGRGDGMDGAKLSIEKLAPSVLSPGWNDGSDSVKPTCLGYQGAGGCKEVLLDERGEVGIAEEPSYADQILGKKIAWDKLAIEDA